MREVAYHEAGHAVVALRLGVRFEYVTIIPDDGAAGHLKHFEDEIAALRRQMTADEWMAAHASPPEVRDRIFAEEERRHLDSVTISIAGIAAQARLDGDDWQEVADDMLEGQYNGDYGAVESLYSGLDDEGKERAYSMVRDDWQAITSVAGALVERNTLTCDEVMEIIAGQSSV